MSDTLSTVSKMIQEVLSEEPLEPVTRDTSFGDDLQFESIELVALAEKIHATYGDSVNIAEWLSEKDLDQLIVLRVGELVDFIDNARDQ